MATDIDKLQVQINVQSVQANSAIDRFVQQLDKLTNSLSRVDGTKASNSTKNITNGLKKSSSAATKANKSFKGLASTFGRFYANCFLIIRATKALWKSINSTADYLEAFNYFEVALNKVGGDWAGDWEKYSEKLGVTSAEEYANSFKTRLNDNLKGLSGIQLSVDADGKTGLLTDSGMKNLGLNIKEVTQYASQLASVTNSVGQTGETSLAAASAFTKLGADMSSLFNMDYSEVMNNLQSGLIGQSRALYKYGIDITNATLQTYAYKVGVSKAVSEMTQAEKMQLRMIAILDQSRVSWGDQANTINSLSNSIRQFKNNIKEAGMILGQLFVPIMNKVMPIVNGLTIAIKRLMVSIAGIFGIKINLEDFGQGSNSAADSMDGFSDSMDDATASAEKLKKATTTLGIDELNINSPKEDTDSGSGSGVGGGIDLTDEILKATEEYEKAWKEAYDRMQNKAEAFANKIEKALEPIKKIFQDFAEGDFFQAGQDVSDLIVSITDFFSRAIAGVDWYKIGQNIGEFLAGINWIEILSSVGKLIWQAINAAIELWKGAFDAAPIETTIVTAVALLGWSGLKGAITAGFTKALAGGISLSSISLNILSIVPVITSPVGIAFASRILDEISEFMQKVIPQGVYKFLNKLGTGIVLGALAGAWFPGGMVAGGIIGGIIGALEGIEIDGKSIFHHIIDPVFNWDSTKEAWESAKENFKKGGLNIVLGIGEGILAALGFLVEPIGDLFVFAWETICGVFGIHSPADEMKPIGENILLGIIEGFSSLFGTFAEKMTEFWEDYISPWFTSEKWFELGSGILEGIQEKWDEIVEWWKTSAIYKWWNDHVAPWFTKKKWEELLGTIPTTFEDAFKSAANFAIDMLNKVIEGVETMVNQALEGLRALARLANKIPGVHIDVDAIQVEFPRIPNFETGGFPEKYSLFMAGENGVPELAGTVGGKTAVAGGAEITGISNAVYSTSEEEVRELREMNSLLRQLLEKDTSVNIGDREIYKASVRGAKAHGRLLLT